MTVTKGGRSAVVGDLAASAPAIYLTRDTVASLWPSFAAMAVFVLIWSVSNVSLKAASGHYGIGGAASLGLVAASQAIDIALALLTLLLVWDKGHAIEFNQLWRVSFVVLAAAMFSIACLRTSLSAQVVLSAAYEVADALVWLVLVDIARHGTLDKAAVCSLGFLVSIRLPDAAGRVAGIALGPAALSEAGIALCMLAIVVAVAFLLPHRSPGVQLLFYELVEPGVSHAGGPGDKEDALDEACERIAQEKGLSKRELEITRFLAAGRSKQYIAETLYLSENTVKTYTRRIYAKLGVHSRGELQNLAGVR